MLTSCLHKMNESGRFYSATVQEYSSCPTNKHNKPNAYSEALDLVWYKNIYPN